jgi:spore germination cell wall hydrolase CwlJ-like protein
MKSIITLLFLLGLNALAITPHEEIQVVSACILLESGGTSNEEMHAVANVIFNRAKNRKITAYEVVKQKHQFSCAKQFQGVEFNYTGFIKAGHNLNKWNQSIQDYTMSLALQGNREELSDITGGADHFHDLSMTPYWAKKLQLIAFSPSFKFYKNL